MDARRVGSAAEGEDLGDVKSLINILKILRAQRLAAQVRGMCGKGTAVPDVGDD